MPTIIACPICHQDVSLPSRVEGALVCPHCDGEFMLAASSADQPTPNGNGFGDKQSSFAPASVDVSPDAVTEAPAETPQARPAGLSDKSGRGQTSSSGIPAFHDADFSRHSGNRPTAPRIADDFDEEDDETYTEYEDEVVEYEAAKYEAVEHEAHEYNVEAEEPAESVNPGLAIDTESSRSPATRGRAAVGQRGRRQKSAFGQLLGVFGGGLLGLAIGYYLLNYFGGPQFNFLNLQLPGIQANPAAADDKSADKDGQDQTRQDKSGTGNNIAGSGRNLRSDNQPGNRSGGSDGDNAPFDADRFVAPEFTGAELRDSLVTASRTLSCRDCEATGFVTQRVFGGNSRGAPVKSPCPTCLGNPFSQIHPSGYQALCDLARTVTWVDDADTSARGSVEALRTLLLQATKSTEQRTLVNQFAEERLRQAEAATSSPGAQSGDGILVVGQIIENRQSGPYFLTILESNASTGAPNRKYVVASRVRAPGLLGESLLVAGAILRDPKSALPDFESPEPLVIWGGFPLVVR